MASLVEKGDRVRIAGMGNRVGTVVEVRGDKVKVDLGHLTALIHKGRVFIASRGGK